MDDAEQPEFTYAELSKRAKETARNKYRDSQLDYNWWGNVYEDAITTGKLIGIEISTDHRKNSYGKSYADPDIRFSGFCSQGDGCCYSGTLRIADLKGCTEKLETHIDGDKTLAALAQRGEEIYNQILARNVAVRMSGEDDPDAIGLESTFIIAGEHRYWRTKISNDYWEDDAFGLDAYVSDFADWIYAQLEAEHDYLLSDEAIEESIEANDLTFDEDGNEL